MKNKKTILIVVLVVVLSFGVHLLMAQTQTSVNSRNERWEYHVLIVSELNRDQIVERANNLRAEGWELVTSGLSGRSGWFTLYFKRRLP